MHQKPVNPARLLQFPCVVGTASGTIQAVQPAVALITGWLTERPGGDYHAPYFSDKEAEAWEGHRSAKWTSRDWNSGFKPKLRLFCKPCPLSCGRKVTCWFNSREDKWEVSFPEPFLCHLHCRAPS